jgi:uncharacterized protein
MSNHTIRTAEELQGLFGPVGEASLRKEVAFLHPTYRRWIEASPFAVVATCGIGGLDASPRGDPAPLVRIVDDKTLLLPERRGNNRVDGLRNLLDDPRIAMLFLVPGIAETLRVNGMASISVDPDLLQSFAVSGALPKCVVTVHIESVYFPCGRAMLRSTLWNRSVEPPLAPSAGEMLGALTGGEIGGPSYDQELPTRQRSTLY